MKKSFSILFLTILLIPGLICAQVGPGLGNLTYTSNELYKGLWTYTEVNHYGSTMATMHNGYMITTFHPDSGKPPGGILVWDVSNPRNPVVVARVYNNQTSTFREQHALPQHDRYIMMQDGFGFQIWDFSNPSNPVQTKRHVMSGYAHDDYGSCWQIFWQAPYIYIANGSRGFDVVDATDMNNPVLVKHINTPRQVGPIFAIGNILYTSAHDFGRGFTFYDISNPRDPQLINSFSNTENMYAAIINGNKMIISARGNANNAVFGTYDVSDPLNITKITTLDIGNSAEQLYCSTQDEFIFQGCQYEIVKIDASIPTAQQVVGRGLLVTANPDHGQVTPFGNLIFGGNDHGSGSGFFVHQTAPDTRSPEVNMVIPKSNDVNRALTSRVGITLTDNIQFESINKNTFIVRPVGGEALNGKYSYQFSIANFSPDQPLQPNTTYEIVIPAGGMKDYAGNAVGTTFTSYFSTGPTGNFPPAQGGTPWLFEENEKISLFWNTISNSSSYVIKRSTSPSGPFETIATVTGLSYTDNDVENGRYYYYTVSGANDFGEGTASAPLRAMPALYVTDMDWTSSNNGWGPVEIDQSNGEDATDDGRVITLNGQSYSRGLGVHASSTVTYNLSGDYARFQSDIGLDDEVGTSGSVIFNVLVDGVQRYTSGLMTGANATKSIDIDVSGANTLTLNVNPDGDNGLDHASWGGARLRLPQQPFYAAPHTIPGRIEAEDFDLGGEGIAYHENNLNGNEGGATYRNDEVDIEETGDIDGEYNVGYILQGEWLEYTVNVLSSTTYELDLRVAADGEGKTLHVEMDGEDITGPITVPNTNGWQTWSTVTVNNINVTAGEHEMRIVFDSDFFNLNYVEFKDLVTGVSQVFDENVKVFPNPFDANGLSLEVDGAFDYTISDILGHQLESGKGENAVSIGNNLPQGTYLLKIKTKGNSMDMKIIKR